MIRYRLLLSLLALPLSIFILWLAFRDKDWRYFTQRLGLNQFVSTKKNNVETVWIHCASVGEVNAVAPILNELSKNNSIVLTTNTVSSANRAKKIFGTTITHYYCPIDWHWAISRFINHVQPNYLFIVETELWPNLFKACHKKGVSITIINGRISSKTLNTSKWMKQRYAACLKRINAVLSRSIEDSKHFITLGANPAIVKTIGNIKYYPDPNIKNIKAFNCNLPYVLAASTSENEEKIIVSAWLQALKKVSSPYLLIIAPRHPHRLSIILEQLKTLNLNISIRSKKEKITPNTNIYIADTFGELISFIKGAKFTLLGSSFIDKGGKNILEVAHSEKMVLFGKSMYNFKDEAKLFIQNQAGIQIQDNKTLANEIITLLSDKNKIQDYEENAINLMHKQKNILNDYIKEIKAIHPNLKV